MRTLKTETDFNNLPDGTTIRETQTLTRLSDTYTKQHGTWYSRNRGPNYPVSSEYLAKSARHARYHYTLEENQ